MSDKKKFWVDSRETHVGAGSYQETYYTDVKGVKAQQTPMQPKPLKTNPDAEYYFYVTAKSYPNIGFLADELYGPTPPEENATEAWFFFTNFNLQIYGMKPIAPGSWLFVPQIKTQYEVDDFHKLLTLLLTSKTQQEGLNENAQTLYGKGVQLLGDGYFALNQIAEAASSGLELMDDNFTEVKQTAESLADLGERVKAAVKSGAPKLEIKALKTEIKSTSHELSEKIQTFLNKVGTPTTAEIKKIKADTSVEWRKNLLSLRKLNVPKKEIDGLRVIIAKGSKIADYSSRLGRILLALGGVEMGTKIIEACKANPESPLCAQAAVGDTSGFVGNIFGGAVGANTVKYAFKNIQTVSSSQEIVDSAEIGGKTSLGEAIGCNLTLDSETVGLGFFACTATIWATSGVASFYGGELSSKVSVKIYEQVFQFLHGPIE